MKTQLLASWDDVVKAYKESRINSEHTMQAVLFASLLSRLEKDYRILCEPAIKMPDGVTFFPDLVILFGSKIHVVLELKFVPHFLPSLEDLKKLVHSATASHSFPVLINPETGRFSEEVFSFAPDCLLGFAVIGQADSKAVDAQIVLSEMDDFSDRFLHLAHGVGR